MSAGRTTRTPPRRAPGATWVACLVAALLVAVAVVAVHDLVTGQGWATGPVWASSLVEALDGLGSSTGLALAGAAVALVGAAFVVLAVLRGRRTHVPVTVADSADADLWLTPGAVAALAHEVVDRSAGVISADVRRSGRRRIVIAASAYRDVEQVLARARDAVDAGIGSATEVRIAVRATKEAKDTKKTQKVITKDATKDEVTS